ncbi:MAG: hypothetical protein N2645_13255 [Clostridia bacterium]|nr:hypothetical protein [Clostridia bacterium]
MKVIGLVAAFMVIACIDVPSLLKKQDSKVKYLTVYGFIIISGFVISLLQVMNKPPVSPAKVIESIIKGITGE